MHSALWFGAMLASIYALITTGSFLTALATFALGGAMIFALHLILLVTFIFIMNYYKDH